MGGVGSGNGYRGGKQTTNNKRSLDVRRLQRDGLLTKKQWYSWSWLRNGEEVASIWIKTEDEKVVLSYRRKDHDGGWQPMEYSVHLTWTSCNLGGRRPWFRCPATGCGRRVAILFSGSLYTCRQCQRLAYQSQRESEDDRKARRADTIRRRLGWDAGILNGPGFKPKGMHWRTFWRLKAEHDSFVSISLSGMAQRFRLISRALDRVNEFAGCDD